MSTNKLPWSQRVTWQMVVVFAIPTLVIGYLGYYIFEPDIRDAGNGYTAVDLKAMSLFDFNQTSGKATDIPEKWRNLDGKKVVLRGEMYAPNEAGDEVHRFDLVYSIAKCCFSGVPQVQHFVNSKPTVGVAPNCNGMLIDVRGTLHVTVKQGDGKVASIYQLDVDEVKPVS